MANLLAGFSAATVATQFPNLLSHLLSAEEPSNPETKNKKEDPPSGAMPVTVPVALVPAPPAIPAPPQAAGKIVLPVGEATATTNEDFGPFAGAHAPAEPASAALGSEILPAGPKVPETHPGAVSVAADGPDITLKNALPECDPAPSSPTVRTEKTAEESSNPQEPVGIQPSQTAAASPLNSGAETLPELPLAPEATATAVPPERSTNAPAQVGRETQRTGASVSRPESTTGALRTAFVETAAPSAPASPTVPEPAAKTLAFAARLIPIERARLDSAVSGRPEPAGASGAPGAPNPPAERETVADAAPSNGIAPVAAPRAAHAVLEAASGHEPKRPDHATPPQPAMQATITPSDPGMPARGAEPAPPRPDPAKGTAEPHPTSSRPEPAQPVTPVRDIRLQVGGERRVDVRVTERGGEVQVAVRTPDSRLAGVLRDELPTLSARLEQSGFRAETWHPDALKIEHAARASEPPAGGAASDGRNTGRQHGREEHHPPPRRAPVSDVQREADSPPKEFSWIFSSLG